ncbi:hypothetical protein [Egbenema bharatensis]|uniref:hypothetical protein n=1 Tax=Egbenema bharatensis TaxID=3463334 RepID=UPI003A8ABA25
MNENNEQPKFRFPLWAYLNQPIFSPKFKSLNPSRFWMLHNIEQLEKNWAKSQNMEIKDADVSGFLEGCWGKETRHIEPKLDPESIRFLERCWAKSKSRSGGLGESRGFFDEE